MNVELLRLCLIASIWNCSSCALQTFDASTGTVHLWGVGHLSVKTTPAVDESKLQAVIVGSDMIGVGVDASPFSSGLGLGYQGKRVSYVVKENTAMRIIRPHERNLSLGGGGATARKDETNTKENIP